MNQYYYSIKEWEYFSHVRMDIISVVPMDRTQKILEVGAGSGNTLAYLKKHGLAAEVMGVELVQEMDEEFQPYIDRFQIADIEKDEIQAERSSFDVIICADVLEHLSDPWAAVEKITGYLKPGGKLIVSIPNIREIKTLSQIVFGADFRYDPSGGIMDKTHLRFFCRKNIRELLTTSALTPIYEIPNFLLPAVSDGKKRRMINRFTLSMFQDLLTVQYIFIAEKKH